MDHVEKRMEALFPEMVSWRRYLHQHPELSFQEVQTAGFVLKHLQQWGLEVKANVGGNGVTGLLRGGKPGPTVALRADMDALPIQDEKACEYVSQVKGVMHACGHDAHTSTLLGLAQCLSEHRDDLAGQVLFIFQHAEEISPGGAKSMIEAGVLEGVDVIYGVHLWTPFQAGTVYSIPGPMMAAADEFHVEILGKGGHGGLPHETVDSILIGSQLVVNLQSIVSRSINPVEPCVVSLGSFHSGSSFNVIAERCLLKGTVRSFDEKVRDRVVERIDQIARHTCAMFGADCTLDYKTGYPPVVNHSLEVERFDETGSRLFGTDNVIKGPPVMAGEDFAYYLHHVPGCFMFVGAGNKEKGIRYPHHHPKFDIDEQSMLHSAKLMLHMTLNYMRTCGTET